MTDLMGWLDFRCSFGVLVGLQRQL